MIRIGLASTALLNSSPEMVIEATKAAGFQGIEWSADVHVAHGCFEDAEKVMMETLRAGLTVIAYGSYYRTLAQGSSADSFKSVLDTTRILQAPIMRVWPGIGSASGLEPNVKSRFIEESRRIGDMAARFGITICYEIHRNTFFDTYENSSALLAEIDHPFVKAAWAPIPGKASSWRSGMDLLARETWVMRAFAWDASGNRHSLKEQETLLGPCVAAYSSVSSNSDMDRFIVVPWLKCEDADYLKNEADTLNAWLAAKSLRA